MTTVRETAVEAIRLLAEAGYPMELQRLQVRATQRYDQKRDAVEASDSAIGSSPAAAATAVSLEIFL